MKQTCKYILQPAKPGQNAIYCNKAVNFIYKKDDDGNQYRYYLPFCAEHIAKVSNISDEE